MSSRVFGFLRSFKGWIQTRGRPIIGLADYRPGRLSAPILSIFTIIDIGHFQNRFADNFLLLLLFFLCKQTYYLQVTLFIGE